MGEVVVLDERDVLHEPTESHRRGADGRPHACCVQSAAFPGEGRALAFQRPEKRRRLVARDRRFGEDLLVSIRHGRTIRGSGGGSLGSGGVANGDGDDGFTRLREDVRFLGALLGQVVAESGGGALYYDGAERRPGGGGGPRGGGAKRPRRRSAR